MHQQVHQRQTRAVLEDQEDLTAQSGPLRPIAQAATRVSGGPRTSAASVSSTCSTSLIVSRTSCPSHFESACEALSAPRSKIIQSSRHCDLLKIDGEPTTEGEKTTEDEG